MGLVSAICRQLIENNQKSIILLHCSKLMQRMLLQLCRKNIPGREKISHPLVGNIFVRHTLKTRRGRIFYKPNLRNQLVDDLLDELTLISGTHNGFPNY